jgi:Flp pilus assembly protein TadD
VNPSYRDALFELGQCYLTLNQPKEALDPLQKVTEIDPDSDQAYFLLGRAYKMLGRSNDAAQAWNICKQIKARKNVQPKPAG